MKRSTISPQSLRHQIATIAARYVAEDGATYAIAKQKAAQQVVGTGRINREVLPDDELIEQQVLLHNQLFLADSQPQRLLTLRRLALRVMQDLEQFNPHLTGAVASGSAGRHDEIVVQLFVDNTKDVAIYLLNKGIQFDVDEAPANRFSHQEPVETLSFSRDNEGVHLVLLPTDAIRRAKGKFAGKMAPRANIEALTRLIEESSTP
jgi:hypothetical protein